MNRKDKRAPMIDEITGATAWPFERKCPECGRMFAGTCALEEWTYRDKGALLCSWGCVRRREKRRTVAELRAAEKRNRKKLTPAQKEGLIRQKVYRGMTNEEISAETGMSVQLVNYYRKKIEEAFET